MLCCGHGDHVGLLVYGVQHSVTASACRPAILELALQRLADCAGRAQEVAGDQLDHRRSYRLWQLVGDSPRSRSGDLEPVGRCRRLGHPSASPLGHEVSQTGLVHHVAGGDCGLALT